MSRPSVRLIATVVGVLLLTSIATPPVWHAFAARGYVHTFARVYDRIFEIALAIALVVTWRRLEVGSLDDIGFRRPRWRAELVWGLRIGFAGLGLALVFAWWMGGIAPALRYGAGKTLQKALLGLTGAGLVGVGEEILFRGILLRRFRLDFGPTAGSLAATAVYAIVHAIRTGGGGGVPDAWAGFGRTLGLFAPVADPVTWPSVVGLFALGLLLAWVRLRTGSLWPCIGIHAGWVAVFRVGRLFFTIRRRPGWVVGPGWPPLIGGATGALAVGVTALLASRAFDNLARRSR